MPSPSDIPAAPDFDESLEACRILGIDTSGDYDYLGTLRALVADVARLRNTIAAVHHQLAVGDASEGDERDIAWCARQLGDALGVATLIVTPAPGCDTPRRFFAHDGESYDASYTTAEEARKAAEAALDRWRTDARDEDGWADEVEAVAWGEVIERAEAVPDEQSEVEDAGCDYRLTRCVVPVIG
jgi:hypothetical protein